MVPVEEDGDVDVDDVSVFKGAAEENIRKRSP
jgi:hypothetical protein